MKMIPDETSLVLSVLHTHAMPVIVFKHKKVLCCSAPWNSGLLLTKSPASFQSGSSGSPCSLQRLQRGFRPLLCCGAWPVPVPTVAHCAGRKSPGDPSMGTHADGRPYPRRRDFLDLGAL